MTPSLWSRGCARLAAELPEQQFNTWIRPLPEPLVEDDPQQGAVVSLRVPNRFKLDWIRTQYALRIESLLSDLAGHPVRLELSLAPREARESREASPLAARVPSQESVGAPRRPTEREAPSSEFPHTLPPSATAHPPQLSTTVPHSFVIDTREACGARATACA